MMEDLVLILEYFGLGGELVWELGGVGIDVGNVWELGCWGFVDVFEIKWWDWREWNKRKFNFDGICFLVCLWDYIVWVVRDEVI